MLMPIELVVGIAKETNSVSQHARFFILPRESSYQLEDERRQAVVLYRHLLGLSPGEHLWVEIKLHELKYVDRLAKEHNVKLRVFDWEDKVVSPYDFKTPEGDGE